MSFWKQSDPQNVTNVTVSEEVKMFEDLEKWTIYCGQVSAFTRIGEGPRSQVECIRTSEDGNYYYLVKPRENWVTFLRKQFEKCRCFYAFHTFLSVFMSSISSLIFFCTSLSISSTVSPVLCFPLSRSPAPYYLWPAFLLSFISGLLSSSSLQCLPLHIFLYLHSMMFLTGSPVYLLIPCLCHLNLASLTFSAMFATPHLLISLFDNVSEGSSSSFLLRVHTISTLLPSPSLQCLPPHIFFWSLHLIISLTVVLPFFLLHVTHTISVLLPSSLKYLPPDFNCYHEKKTNGFKLFIT